MFLSKGQPVWVQFHALSTRGRRVCARVVQLPARRRATAAENLKPISQCSERAQVSLRWECAASRTGGQATMSPVTGRGPLWQAAWPRERPCRLDPGDRVVSLQVRAL